MKFKRLNILNINGTRNYLPLLAIPCLTPVYLLFSYSVANGAIGLSDYKYWRSTIQLTNYH